MKALSINNWFLVPLQAILLAAIHILIEFLFWHPDFLQELIYICLFLVVHGVLYPSYRYKSIWVILPLFSELIFALLACAIFDMCDEVSMVILLAYALTLCAVFMLIHFAIRFMYLYSLFKARKL